MCVEIMILMFADIEKALMKIDEMASNQDGIAAEEALILRGYVFVCIRR